LEVHHIRERSTADVRGILADGSSVHAKANLVVLCDKCHDEHHRAALDIGPFIQTSDGPEESVMSVATPYDGSISSNGRKSKWSQEQLVTIENACVQYKSLSNSNLSKFLLNHHQIEISGASLKKLRG
jgi:hypothetical protein